MKALILILFMPINSHSTYTRQDNAALLEELEEIENLVRKNPKKKEKKKKVLTLAEILEKGTEKTSVQKRDKEKNITNLDQVFEKIRKKDETAQGNKGLRQR